MIPTKEIPFLTDKDIQRFWSKVDIKSDKETCWEWLGGVDKNGYGRMKVQTDRRTLKTHRLSYYLSNNRTQTFLLVCHHCDNPKCCNPTHLFLGTARDNRVDCFKKGRAVINSRKGEDSPTAKITNKQAETIIKEYYSGKITQSELCEKYNTSSVSVIISGKVWKHIPRDKYILGKAKPRHTTAKITEKQALSIIEEYKKGDVSYFELGVKYGINLSSIGAIVKGKSWKHLHKVQI